MAPAQHELEMNFEELNGPVAATASKTVTFGKSLMQRLSQLWNQLRRYG